MDSDPNKPLELSLDPIEPPPTKGADAAAGSDGARPSMPRIASADRFLAQAADEYERGIVDEPLWQSATAQTRGDEALVVAAYLRARATALQIQERGRRAEQRAASAHAAPPPVAAAKPERPSRMRGLSTRMRVAGAAAVGVAIAAAATLIGMSGGDDAPVPTAATTARKQSVTSAAPAAETARQAALAAEQQAAAEREALLRKVESLEQANNWNVQVLYAAEWTRKEPDNAEAWSRLSAGYLRLDQLDEAYEAAKRAVEVAPEDATRWGRLGNLYLVLQRPEDARQAIERALSLDPNDTQALCGSFALAMADGRRKDAAVIGEQLGEREASCARHDEAAPPTRTVDAATVVQAPKPRGR